jgi:hypothetical protein
MWLRRGVALVVVAGVVGAGAAIAGGRGAAWGTGAAIALAIVVGILLPRWAHRAFARGQLAAARRRYRATGATALTRRRRHHARISIAACHLAAGDHRDADAALSAIDVGELDVDGRAVWLNNRAYAALRCSELGVSADAALAWADEAAGLRPDVPAIGHTRGLALLEVGRLDDAIRVLEGLWGKDELAPQLEAERCADLARAWRAKGHADYAADYEARGRRFGVAR